MKEILALCTKLPPNHCGSVFGSRLRNALDIEREFLKTHEAMYPQQAKSQGSFSAGHMPVGGEVSRSGPGPTIRSVSHP
jgi:hypothetical protein